MKTFTSYMNRSIRQDDGEDLVYMEGKLFGVIHRHGNESLDESIVRELDNSNMYDTIEDIRKKDNGMEHPNDHHSLLVQDHPGIPKHMEKHVRKYVDSSYSLNKGLFVKHTTGKNPLEDRPVLKNTINGLDQLHHPVSKEHVVYSGIRWSPETASGMVFHHNDDHIAMHLPAFTSTSTSLFKAVGFAKASERTDGVKHVLRFNLKRGDKILPINRELSFFPDENEVVLPRNTIIKISRSPSEILKPKEGSLVPSEHTHIWDAHIIHQPRENDPV